MKEFKQSLKLLKDHGFEIFEAKPVVQIRMEGIINPADIRTRVSKILSEHGYENYYLSEVYYFAASKHPHRTDQYGCVEYAKSMDFTYTKRITFKPGVKAQDGIQSSQTGV